MTKPIDSEIKLLKRNARMALKVAVVVREYSDEQAIQCEILQRAVNILLGPEYKVKRDTE